MSEYLLTLANLSPLHFGKSIMQTDRGKHLRNEKKKIKKIICPKLLGLKIYRGSCTISST